MTLSDLQSFTVVRITYTASLFKSKFFVQLCSSDIARRAVPLQQPNLVISCKKMYVFKMQPGHD